MVHTRNESQLLHVCVWLCGCERVEDERTSQVQFMCSLVFPIFVLYSAAAGAVMSDPVTSVRASHSDLLFQKTELVLLSKCQHGVSSVLGSQ